MKRSTVIIGLGLCGIVYLFGREQSRVDMPTLNASARPNIDQLVRASHAAAPSKPHTSQPIPQIAAAVIDRQLPNQAARLSRLEREYRDHAGFRQLVADFNAETGHPGRGETASIKALDQDAVAGAPAFALFQAVQPRAEMLRAFEQHWRHQRERPDQYDPPP